MDTYGNDLQLSLSMFEIDKTNTYLPAGIYNTAGTSIDGAFLMKFVSGANNVYVYIPYT